MRFTHPLARHAKVWPIHMNDGTTVHALLIATTLELDPESMKLQRSHVDRLADAARDFVRFHPEVTAFSIVNARGNGIHRGGRAKSDCSGVLRLASRRTASGLRLSA